MKNLNPFILLSLTLLIASCNEDEVSSSASKDNLLVMKAFYFRHNYGENQLVVVTDQNGTILSAAKSSYWQDTPIKPPFSGSHTPFVNLYLIDRYDATYSVTAFLHLRRGSEFIGPNYEYRVPQLARGQYKLTNVQPFDYLTLSSDFNGFSIEQLADTVGQLQNMYSEGRQTYGQVISNGKGYYGFFDIDNESAISTIDLAGMNKPSTRFSFDLGPDVTYSNFSLTGSFDAESQGWGYQLFSAWGRSQLDVFYPEEPFAKYFTSLSYYANERNYVIGREASSLNLDYEKITFNGVVTSASPQNFRMDFTGKFDHYVASYMSADYTRTITVYSSQHNSSFRIPDFSRITGVEKFPFEDLSWLSVEMRDFDELNENGEHFQFFTSGNYRWPRNMSTVTLGMAIR